MISLDNLKTTLNAIKCLLNDYPKKEDIPTALPNPNVLTFTGAVTGSYDGSKALTVRIPLGSGGGSISVEDDGAGNVEITEVPSSWTITDDGNGNVIIGG